MVSLPPRMRSSMRKCRDDSGRLEITGPLETDDIAQVLGWLAVIDTPPTRLDLVQEITRCLSLTTSRNRSDMDLKLMLAALVEELSDLPADALKAALRKWARLEKWWPTLSEIRNLAQEQMRLRSSLRYWCEADDKTRKFMADHYSRR